MPSRDLIEKFAHENGITIERGALSATIGRFLTTSADNKAREAKIRQFIEAEYPRIAKEFERNKVQSAVLKQETVSSTTAWELLESYVNIVSEVVKETYDDMLKQNAEERQKAQALLDEANEKNAKAQQIYESVYVGYPVVCY